jgi:undecaprenyl-diphosphatase
VDERRPVAWLGACAAAGLLGVLVVAVLIHGGRPLAVDLALHDWAVRNRPSGARWLAVVITATGTGPIPYLLAAAGAVTGTGLVDRVRRAAWGILLLAVVQSVRFGLVSWIARPRPPSAGRALDVSGFAFPSGHTTTSATAAAIVVWLAAGRLRGVPRAVVIAGAAGWAVAVGLTRIYLGVHWPSDVLGGWLFTAVMLIMAGVLIGWARGRRG